MAAGEIKRFVDRFGLMGLVDIEGKPYVDAGLGYMKLSDSELLSRIASEPKLLRLPLIRAGNQISIGQDEASWKAMVPASDRALCGGACLEQRHSRMRNGSCSSPIAPPGCVGFATSEAAWCGPAALRVRFFILWMTARRGNTA